MTTWSFALNYGANRLLGAPGESPVPYRLLNLLLHAAVACLVYRLLVRLRMEGWGAAAAAFLFAAAPIHTEAVASVVGRAELLATLFGLWFLIAHRENRSPPLPTLLFFLALLSKESAAAFLALCLWTDLWIGREGKRWRWRPYTAYAGVALAWFAIRSLVISGTRMVILKIDNPLAEAPALERVLTAATIQLDYLRLQLVPIGLSSDYSFNQIPIVSTPADLKMIGFLLLLVGAAALGYFARRNHRLIPYCLVGYAVLFLPAGNFLFPIGTIMAERLAYAPSIFFCSLLAYGALVLRPRAGRAIVGILAAAVLVSGVLTILRNRTWADLDTFARAQLRSAPNSAKANYNVGTVEQAAGRLDAAATRFRRALEILPEYGEALNNLGIIYKDKGELETAIQYYKRSIELRPNSSRPLFNLGQAYHLKGQLDLAAEAYRSAIRLRPDYLQALSNLAAIYLVQGRVGEAEDLWNRCLRIDPRYETARVNLGRLREARTAAPGK